MRSLGPLLFKARNRVDPDLLKSARGFTLIEILIVVAILAIAAAIAMPSVIDMRNAQLYGNAARTVGSKLRQARAQAIATNQPVTVTINNSLLPNEAAYQNAVNIVSGTATVTFSTNGSTTLTSDLTISIRNSAGVQKHTVTIKSITGSISIN